MSQLAFVQNLIEELGPATSSLISVSQLGDETWGVVFEDETIVTLELDQDRGVLVLSGELGSPAASRKGEVCAALLNYTLLWRETGGVKMALGGEEDTAFQLYDLDCRDTSLVELQNVLENFADKARIWRSYVAGTGDAPLADAPPLGMRV
jgi:hypothetical protein